MKITDYEPPDRQPSVERIARNAMDLSGNPEPTEGRTMHYVMENLVQYDLSDQDVATLKKLGFICDGDGQGHPLEVTAFVWNDLGLEGDRAFELFDRVLGRTTDDETVRRPAPNSGIPDPHRTILVHLNVGVPADERRSVDEVVAAILDQLGLARQWRPGVRDLVFDVPLAEEIGDELTPTGHVRGAVYRSSFWGGNYRVLGVSGDETLVEVVSAGPQPVPAVGDTYSTNAQLSPLDNRLELVAWVGRVDGTGPVSLGFPSVESAEQHIAVHLEKVDPVGVEQGAYFIDAMEGDTPG